MSNKFLAGVALAALAGTMAVLWAPWASSTPGGASACGTTYAPVLDPAHFVSVIDNPYFPLPVGRKLVYTGTKDGQSQVDTVTVTNQTKVILGITTTVVNDVATHDGTVLEKTFDYYAQDDQGNVWYLGEDTTHFLPNGKADTSGSFQAGVGGAQPGIIMEANPQIPDAYRQECFAGEAGGHRMGRGDRGFVEGPLRERAQRPHDAGGHADRGRRVRREDLRSGDRHRERAVSHGSGRIRAARQRERVARGRTETVTGVRRSRSGSAALPRWRRQA
jgi:hypothetical protein